MSRRHLRYLDPDAKRNDLPTYPWRSAPVGLATAQQLRELGLLPGGEPVAAQAMRRRRGDKVVAYLYDVSSARPRRITAPAPLATVNRALCVRRTCPSCDEIKPYVIPRALGECFDCAEQPHQSSEVA